MITKKFVDFDCNRWVRNGVAIDIPKFRCPDRAWKWLKKHGFGRLPADRELVFLKSLSMAIDYAVRIDSRLPKIFEDKIKENIELAYRYVQDVIEAPFVEYEGVFNKSPKILVKYAKNVLKSRLPAHLEICLMGDPYSCFEYAWGVLDGRLPEDLHNYMFGANMDSSFGRRYRGKHNSKLHDADEYNPDHQSPSTYFEFIKWQRKNLCRLVKHYAEVYSVDSAKPVSEFLYELENGH